MGFGLFVVGYATMLTWGLAIDRSIGLGFDILPDLIGYLLFFKGLGSLRPYSKGFVLARYITMPLLVLGGATLAAQTVGLVSTWVPALVEYRELLVKILSIVDTISVPLLFFFHLYLCQGIRDLAAEVELGKIVTRSRIAALLSSVFYLGKLLCGIVSLHGIGLWFIAVLSYVVYFYYLYLLYSCYMHIVYADETPTEASHPLARLLDKIKKNDSNTK